MLPSGNCIALIKQWESCQLTAYQDSAGIWTIGWGTTGPGIVEGLTISQATADGMFKGHVLEVGLDLSDLLGRICSQNQFDALVSFVYNIGIGAFKASTMLKLLLARQFKEASEEFPKWDKVSGIAVPGLLSRRLAEQSLFLS